MRETIKVIIGNRERDVAGVIGSMILESDTEGVRLNSFITGKMSKAEMIAGLINLTKTVFHEIKDEDVRRYCAVEIVRFLTDAGYMGREGTE